MNRLLDGELVEKAVVNSKLTTGCVLPEVLNNPLLDNTGRISRAQMEQIAYSSRYEAFNQNRNFQEAIDEDRRELQELDKPQEWLQQHK